MKKSIDGDARERAGGGGGLHRYSYNVGQPTGGRMSYQQNWKCPPIYYFVYHDDIFLIGWVLTFFLFLESLGIRNSSGTLLKFLMQCHLYYFVSILFRFRSDWITFKWSGLTGKILGMGKLIIFRNTKQIKFSLKTFQLSWLKKVKCWQCV